MLNLNVAVMMVNNENVPTLLHKSYKAQMSATVHYRSLDSALAKKNTRFNQIYIVLANEYKLHGIEVKPGSAEERQISLYQAHVDRFFNGSWTKVKPASSFKDGKKVKVRKVDSKKGKAKKPTLTSERADKLASDEDCLQAMIEAVRKAGYNVSKVVVS